MGDTLRAGIGSGVALTGVLAIAGMAAARYGKALPHLGIGAVGAAVAVAAGRLMALPAPLLLLIVGAAGAGIGAAAWALDDGVRRASAPLWPPLFLPDVAVMGLAMALAALLRPELAVELPLGPLGGFPTAAEAWFGLVLGVGAVAVVGTPAVADRHEAVTWAIVCGTVAVAAVLGSGLLSLRGQSLAPVFGLADVVGLGVRAAAVGVLGRRGAVWSVGTALVLGVGESLLRSAVPQANLALAPLVVVLLLGFVPHPRPAPKRAVAP